MFLDNLINKILNSFVNKYQQKSFEKILQQSLQIIDSNTFEEIRSRTEDFINVNGSFCDRAGKGDLYYSLFGMFVWETMNPGKINKNLKIFVENYDLQPSQGYVYLYCLSIIHTRLFSGRAKSLYFQEQIENALNSNPGSIDYHSFMGILALFYLKDYLGIFKIIKKIKLEDDTEDLPCTVLAAKLVLKKLDGKNINRLKEKLMTHYRGDGSFSALKNSPIGDLLSTSVALYALKFIDADIRIIKPSCLTYIDSLYSKGNFRSTSLDIDGDIEYTFYGLLALGALA